MVEHKNESLEMDLTGSALSTKAGGTVMLVVKGAFDMRPPEGLVFIPIRSSTYLGADSCPSQKYGALERR